MHAYENLVSSHQFKQERETLHSERSIKIMLLAAILALNLIVTTLRTVSK